MNTYRSILSLFLLSAYALLLLHDFVPHSHYSDQGTVHVASDAHGHHEGHHHSHEHSDDNEKDENTPEPSDKSSVVAILIHAHSHSSFDGHHYQLVYRVESKDKLIPQTDVVAYRPENKWTLPNRLNVSNVNNGDFIQLLSRQFRTSSHGLRAPPALG